MDVCKWEAVLYSPLQIINHELEVVTGPLSCDVPVPGGIKMVCTCYLWCWLLEIKYYCWSRKCCDTQSACLYRAEWRELHLPDRLSHYVQELNDPQVLLLVMWLQQFDYLLTHSSYFVVWEWWSHGWLNVSCPVTRTTFCFCLYNVPVDQEPWPRILGELCWSRTKPVTHVTQQQLSVQALCWALQCVCVEVLFLCFLGWAGMKTMGTLCRELANWRGGGEVGEEETGEETLKMSWAGWDVKDDEEQKKEGRKKHLWEA